MVSSESAAISGSRKAAAPRSRAASPIARSAISPERVLVASSERRNRAKTTTLPTSSATSSARRSAASNVAAPSPMRPRKAWSACNRSPLASRASSQASSLTKTLSNAHVSSRGTSARGGTDVMVALIREETPRDCIANSGCCGGGSHDPSRGVEPNQDRRSDARDSPSVLAGRVRPPAMRRPGKSPLQRVPAPRGRRDSPSPRDGPGAP